MSESNKAVRAVEVEASEMYIKLSTWVNIKMCTEMLYQDTLQRHSVQMHKKKDFNCRFSILVSPDVGL